MDAIEPTTFDEFYLRRYATAVVPLTLSAIVASVPGVVVLWHAPSLPGWHVALAILAIGTLFVLAWLSRVFARQVAMLPVTATMGAFSVLAVTLVSWEAHVRQLGVLSVLPTAIVVSFIAASFCVRYWQVLLSWVLVLAPILAFAIREPEGSHRTAQLVRFFVTMAVTSTIFYAAVIRVKWGYFTMIRQLREQSRTDALTGLLNRSAWMDTVARVRAASPSTASMAVLYIDLDRFKSVNDRDGHAAGDAMLKDAATIMTGVFGPEVAIARFGGDEFVIFLPDATAGRVEKGLEALRTQAATIRMTFSAGSAMVGAGMSIDEALALADAALLAAKAAGRDRFVTGTRVG